MIRRLVESDLTNLMDYISEEPAVNLFIIGDVEQFGMEADFQTLWGLFGPEGNNLKGVLLRFRTYYTLYAKEWISDLEDLADIVREDLTATSLAGKESLIENLKPVFESEKIKRQYFCELTQPDQLLPLSDKVKQATAQDGQRIFNLLKSIDEFSLTDTESAENISDNIRSGLGRTFLIEDEEGHAVSMAQTTAENSRSAMVVGVATLESARKSGYASQCVSNLCRALLQEGRTLCLFYDNPKAGTIYHRLGFKPIDRWMMRLNKGKYRD